MPNPRRAAPSSRTHSPASRGGDTKVGFAPPPLVPPRVNRETSIHYTPWLLIRDAAGDGGARPLPPGAVFWESPDVWVVSSLGVNQPVVGEPNQVFARVTNLGWQEATGVEVLFFWANPSLGITEATAVPIGSGHADIPSGWSVVVPCDKPWIPVEENGGHECLIAEAIVRQFDPLTAPMDPVDDRHVGQKNEQLVLLPAGTMFRINVTAANIVNLPQTLNFEVQPLKLATLHPLLQVRALSLGVALSPPSAALPVSLEFAAAPPVFIGPSVIFARRLFTMAEEEVAGRAGCSSALVQIARSAAFEPWETRKLEVTGQIPQGAKVGDTFAFRIVQRIGTMVTGGYTVNVAVTEGKQRA
jgi:hypothetical protein